MPHWFAGCGMLVVGGLCYRRLLDKVESLVSRKVHQLLRVPPTGSSASGVKVPEWTVCGYFSVTSIVTGSALTLFAAPVPARPVA